MNTNSNELEHGNMSPNTDVAESVDASSNAIKQSSPKVSKDDFIQKEKPVVQVDEAELQRARERKAEEISDAAFNKFIEVWDNWDLDFSRLPKDLAWAKERIQKKFSNPMAVEPRYHAPQDINSIVEQKFKEKEFENEVWKMLSDDSLSDEQKQEIKQEYLELSTGTMNVRAFKKAEEIVRLRSSSRKIIGSLPNIWRPSVDWSKKSTISNEHLHALSQSEYNKVMDSVEKWHMSIVS